MVNQHDKRLHTVATCTIVTFSPLSSLVEQLGNAPLAKEVPRRVAYQYILIPDLESLHTQLPHAKMFTFSPLSSRAWLSSLVMEVLKLPVAAFPES